MRWPFSKPKHVTKAQLLQQADEHMQQGVSRQAIGDTWLNMDRSKLTIEEMTAYSEAEQALFGVMVDRNQQGITLERSGQLDEAIALYEANINDRFVGTHPYERLRIIYTKRKDYEQAIRVCQTFVGLQNVPADKKAQFKEHIQKLRQKRDA